MLLLCHVQKFNDVSGVLKYSLSSRAKTKYAGRLIGFRFRCRSFDLT